MNTNNTLNQLSEVATRIKELREIMGFSVDEMTEKVVSVCEMYSGKKSKVQKGSTDCNIPMSMGVPAIAFGTHENSSSHTREEKLLIESIPAGLKIAAHMILSECGL